MINPFAEVNWNPDLKERRKFAFSLIIGFAAVAMLFFCIGWVKHSPKPFMVWLGIIGCTVCIVLWLLPQIAKPFYLAWYFLAGCISFVIGNLIFCTFFYLIFTSFGLCLRLRKNKAITKGFDKSAKTYWRNVEKTIDLKRYYRQF
jgi:hypothetical protein